VNTAAKVRVVGAHAHGTARSIVAVPVAANINVATGTGPAGVFSVTATVLPGAPVTASDTHPT
jgi:hypothetical protein